MTLSKRDNAEYVIFVLCIMLALAVTPFAVMRILDNDWVMAALDTSIILSMGALVGYVYKTRRHQLASILVASVFVGATIVTTHLQGISQLPWAYPAFTVTFYLLSPMRALAATIAALLSIVPIITSEGAFIEHIKIIFSLAINIIAAFSFAKLTQKHRKELNQLMKIDPLTLTGNRRAMDMDVSRLLEEHNKYGTALTAFMIDIDHFKTVNDTYGHLFGDGVIAQTAKVIATHMRDNERLYRYGGEEFLVVARNINEEDASILAERLRKHVEVAPFERDIHLTISLGVAHLGAQEDVDDWLKRADKALYQAKDQGRNCVVLAPATEATASAAAAPQ